MRLLRSSAVRRAGALLLGVAVAGLAGLVWAPPAAAEPGASLVVSDPSVAGGRLRFGLSAVGLPGSPALTPENLTVTAEGIELPVTLEPATSPPGAEPARGVILAVDASTALTSALRKEFEAGVGAYLKSLPADVAVGVVSYADTVTRVLPPSLDRETVRSSIAALGASAQPAPSGGPSQAAPGGGPSQAAPGGGPSQPASAPGPSGSQPNPSSTGGPSPAAGGGKRVLRDAVKEAAAGFSGPLRQRRVIVLAAGADQGSATPASTLGAALAGQQVAVDLVSYGQAKPETELADLVTRSGGQVVTAADQAGRVTAVERLATRFAGLVTVTASVPSQLSGKQTTAVVAVTAAGQSSSAVFPVAFTADRSIATALKTSSVRVLPAVVLFVAMGLIGLAVAVAGFAGVYQLLGRSVVGRRLREIDRFTGGDRPAQPVEVAKPEGGALMRSALALSERAVQRSGRSGIEQSLDRAAIALRPAEWMLLRAVLSIVASGVLILVLPWFLALPVGLLGGWFGTGKYLKIKAAQRARKFGDLLPEALNLVVGALRSGFSLLQSIDAVVREGPEPVAGEFGRAMAEIRLGVEVEEALERVAERNGSRDLAWLVMAIRIQREVGGNLSEVLETAVDTMRERGRLTRHVRALSAEGRLSAYVLVGMPIALTAFLFVARREYLRPMYTQPLGILLLLGAAALLSAGAFVISRMVKVQV